MYENLTPSEKVGLRLKILRLRSHLETYEAAQAIQITRNQLNKYERGLTEQPLNIVDRLAILYNSSLEYVASGKGIEKYNGMWGLDMFGFFTKFSKKKLFGPRDVLVGIVKDKSQYDINISNNFYHIPAKRIYMLDLPVKYVALFKSDRMFSEDEAGIYVYGKVKGISLKKRCQITEIPRNSNEEYFRFDIEKWIYLKQPIKNCEISKTHMFTSLKLLLSAKTIPELYMQDENSLKFFSFLEKQCNITTTSEIKLKGCVYNGIKVGFTPDYIEIIYPNSFHTKYNRSMYYKKPYKLFCDITNT